MADRKSKKDDGGKLVILTGLTGRLGGLKYPVVFSSVDPRISGGFLSDEWRSRFYCLMLWINDPENTGIVDESRAMSLRTRPSRSAFSPLTGDYCYSACLTPTGTEVGAGVEAAAIFHFKYLGFTCSFCSWMISRKLALPIFFLALTYFSVF